MFRTQYGNAVNRRSIPALLMLSAAICFASASSSSAQSKTSSSAHASTSVSTSHAASPTRATQSTTAASNKSHNNSQNHPYRRYAYYPYAYGVTAPSDSNGANTAANGDDTDCRGGGPTIFDRCGSGPPSYPPAANTSPAHRLAQTQPGAGYSADAAPADSSPTTLIFKDGHQIEVGNYAIVGHTLYDLTPGHSNKVALTDIDLDATKKQNGPDFELAPSAQSN